MKELLLKVWNGICFAFLPLTIGIGGGLFLLVIVLASNLSDRVSECRFTGDYLGYASQYTKANGCEFKVNNKWTKIDDLTFIRKD